MELKKSVRPISGSCSPRRQGLCGASTGAHLHPRDVEHVRRALPGAGWRGARTLVSESARDAGAAHLFFCLVGCRLSRTLPFFSLLRDTHLCALGSLWCARARALVLAAQSHLSLPSFPLPLSFSLSHSLFGASEGRMLFRQSASLRAGIHCNWLWRANSSKQARGRAGAPSPPLPLSLSFSLSLSLWRAQLLWSNFSAPKPRARGVCAPVLGRQGPSAPYLPCAPGSRGGRAMHPRWGALARAAQCRGKFLGAAKKKEAPQKKLCGGGGGGVKTGKARVRVDRKNGFVHNEG